MIDPEELKSRAFAEVVHRYDSDDAMLYALAIGAGADPVSAWDLRFVNDTTAQPAVLPTMAVVLGFPGSWMQDPSTGIDFARIVHGDERVVWHGELPRSGTVVAKHRVTHVVDKGPGRGALIVYEKDLYEHDSGRHLATVTHTTFARGDGGFATPEKPGDAALPYPAPVPPGAPDLVVEVPTLPQQALLYRLCADRNPLHSDPRAASLAGFPRPILHGLCTWGMAGFAVLRHFTESKPSRMKSLYARFSAPVIPGDVLRIEFHQNAGDVRFRVTVPARSETVLDYGHAVISS